MYQHILSEKSGPIATITLNRPEFSNAFAVGSYSEIQDALECWGNDPEIRVIIITGQGKHFSAGGDIRSFKARIDSGEFLKRGNVIMAGAMSTAVRTCPKPVIAMVNGAAAGAGCALALACDFRVLEPKSRLGLSFINMGLSGDTGALYFLQRMVGLAKATEWMALGSMIDGNEANRFGLVTRLAEEGSLYETTLELANELAKKPTQAIARQKELIYEFFCRDLLLFNRREADFMYETARTADYKEAVTAFLEKRRPQFEGC